MKTLTYFQILLGDISCLWSTIGIGPEEVNNFVKTLDGNKDLNSPRKVSAEAERELALVEEKLQKIHVDHVYPNINCILAILPSKHSPTGILMQREDIILEWIFLSHKLSKKFKIYVEKISKLIKRKTETSSISRNRPSRNYSTFQ